MNNPAAWAAEHPAHYGRWPNAPYNDGEDGC